MSVTAKALWYIESHLDGDLSLVSISAAVGVSRFHLSRAFPVSLEISLAAYVRGRRLSEAAKLIARGAPDILAVALEACYGSHEAFTRAFRQLFGLTPEQLRAQTSTDNIKLWKPIRMQQTTETAISLSRIADKNAMLIFGLSQKYKCPDNAGIPSQWNRFVPYLGQIPGQVGRIAYGVIYNSDDAGNFDYMCGVEVTSFPCDPAEFTSLRIPPQTYAVFEHRDHISTIGATFERIWNQGLPASGYQAADGPSIERYGEEFDGRTGFGGLEIWIPIKK